MADERAPGDGPELLDQAELDALFAGASGGAPAPAPPAPDESAAADTGEAGAELMDTAAISSLLADMGEAGDPFASMASAPLPTRPAGPAVARGGERVGDLDLLAEVVLELSAEIGRAEMSIDDILKLRPGSLIELDKLAGEPVELYVNGRCIARGEVVVVEDNFGVRITELGSLG